MIKFGFFLKQCCSRLDWWSRINVFILLWSTLVKRHEPNMLNSQNLSANTFMRVRENNVMQKSTGSHLR